MPLLSLWESDPKTVEQFTVQQAVSFAGDGKLKDGSDCSLEFRKYLSQIETSKLKVYVEQCLGEAFDKSGLVLQDLINELGRRLDFQVQNGFYLGRKSAIGNDGLWKAPEGNHIILEVKTTDAYRMSMDTIAGYRARLIDEGKIGLSSSILIVVGREDTGELEAQVRGSRHAWDIRLISADALVKMVLLKENSDEEETGQKIRSILVPVEYTRVDGLVDVVFTTASDLDSELEEAPALAAPTGETKLPRSNEVTDKDLLNAKRFAIISAMSNLVGSKLLKRTRAMYWSADRHARVACTISKRYEDGPGYWYAFHPSWKEFLEKGTNGYFVLGCMGRNDAFSIPLKELVPYLDFLNTTHSNKGRYWHIHLEELPNGQVSLVIPKRENVSLGRFRIDLPVQFESASS